MQTKNKISLARKALYGIMLLAVFLSAFGAGNLPAARAQENTPETPTPTSDTPTPEGVETSTPTNEPPACYTLDLVVAAGEGTLTAITPPNCEGGYLEGTAVEIVAQPAEGFILLKWNGADEDSTQNPINSAIIINNLKIEIYFETELTSSDKINNEQNQSQLEQIQESQPFSNSVEKILYDYNNEIIDRATAYQYIWYVANQQNLVPEQYKIPVRDLDPRFFNLENMDLDAKIVVGSRDVDSILFSLQDKDDLSAQAAEDRPVIPNELTLISPSGHFRIHYLLSQVDWNGDQLYDNVPNTAYVQNMANYFDTAWSTYIDSYGFKEPDKDGSTGGGNDEYDIYVYNRGINNWGKNNAEFCGINICSWILFNSDFSWYANPNTTELKINAAQKVTAAHEFFHAIQRKYDINENLWILEGTAVLAEDMVFDEANDYIDFSMTPYFNDLDNAAFSGHYSRLLSLDYQAIGYWKFLLEKYGTNNSGTRCYQTTDPGSGVDSCGRDILKGLWDYWDDWGVDDTEAVDKILQSKYGISNGFSDVFLEFAIANYVKDFGNPVGTGWLDYLEDEVGTGYATVSKTTQSINASNLNYPFSSQYLSPWSSLYYEFNLDPSISSVYISFDGDNPGGWNPASVYNVAIVKIKNGQIDGSIPVLLASETNGRIQFSTTIQNNGLEKFAIICIGMDHDGTYNLQVNAHDLPPTINSTNQTGVPSTNILATFSKDMNGSTFTNSSVIVSGSSTGAHTSTFSFNHSTHELTINPDVNFAYGETVYVTIGTGIADLNGNHLAFPYNFSFQVSNVLTYTISGYVYEGINLLSGVFVTDGDRFDYTENGYYEITGVPNGDHVITASLEGYSFNPPSKPVTISGSNASLTPFYGTPVSVGACDPTCIFYPVADTSIRSTSPSTSYGLDPRLWIGPNDKGLIRFDLGSLTGEVAYFSRLHLYFDYDGGVTNTFTVHKMEDSWNESITSSQWNHDYYSIGDDGTISGVEWELWDGSPILNAVNNWLTTPSTNYGFVILSKPGVVSTHGWVSKEGNSTYRPYLEVKILNLDEPPDLIISEPRPLNGSVPFLVGQTINWEVTSTNLGPGDAVRNDVGYYLGISPTDYSNRIGDDVIGPVRAGRSLPDNDFNYTFTQTGAYYLNMWVDDNNGNGGNGDITETNENNNKNSFGPFQVIVPNTAPSIGNLPDTPLAEDALLNNSIDLWAYVADDQSQDSELVFTINNQPNPIAGVSIDGNRYIDVNPALNWFGFVDIEIKVQDPQGLSTTDTFRVTVNSVNDIPWISPVIPDKSASFNQPITIDLTAYEHDVEDNGVNLDWMVSGLDNATVTGQNSEDDVLVFTPTTSFTGNDVVTLTLRDSQSGQATQNLTLTWGNINTNPTLTWTGETNYTSDGLHPESGNTSTSYGYRAKYTDADGHAPSYVRVHIKQGGVDIVGSPFAMTCSGITYTTGVVCAYTKAGLPAGINFTYYFTAQDNQSGNATQTTEKDAPDVSGNLLNFYFSSDSYTVNESTGTASIRLILSAPATGTERVYFDQTPGTATTADYTPSFGYANFFTVGQTYVDLPIPIINDTLQEGSESFTVTLSQPIDSQVGTPSTAVVNIIDDDTAPANDDFNSAVVISNFPYSTTLNVTNATTAGDDPVQSCTSGSKKAQSVWYRYTPSSNRTIRFDSTGSNFETTFSIWTGTRGALTSQYCTYQDPFNFNANAGITYYIEVTNWDGGTTPPKMLQLLITDITAEPEMDVKGNGVSIADGDTTPSTTDHTDFGTANITGGIVSRTFTIYNTGNADLNLTGTPKVSVSGTNASDFTVTVQPSSLITFGNSTTFTVVFDPNAANLRTATISVANNDLNESPYNFSIQGTGTTTSPEIDLRFNDNGASIADGDTTPSTGDGTDFGNADVATGSVSHWFRVWNTGTASLNLTGNPRVVISGTHASDFTLGNQPASPIGGGSNSTQFEVIFNPSGAGVRTATISIANDDANENPYNFSISGAGVIPSVPGAAILTYPLGSIGTNYNPTYTWNKVTTATWYRLYVSGPSGVVLDQWYQAADICDATTCTVASPTMLGGGAHAWYVQTYNPVGYGPWSNNTQPTNFNTSPIPLPGPAVLTAPIGNIGTNYTPNYTWNKVSTATWYRLHVSGPSGIILDQWYESSSICNSTTCSVASPTLLGGTHAWYVQTYNSAGYGEWSNNTQPTNFSTTPIPLPGPATNLSPNTAIGTNYNPTYTWNKATDAVYYELYVRGPKGVVLDQWYLASSICNATTCSVASSTPLGGGAHAWYVQTWNSTGYGPWSNNTQPTNFSTTIPTIPVAAVLTNPSGTITNHTPTYQWNRVNMATWYRLYVSGPGGVVKDQWYQAASICNATTCSVVSPSLPSGAHIWYVQAYNVAGYSAWASSTFTVNP